MTLSDHEQRTLDSIEIGCRRKDPGFADRMNLTAAPHRRGRAVVLAPCLCWIGWLVLMIGGGMARGPISIGAFTACYGFGMMGAGIVMWLRNRGPRRRSPAGS